MLGRQLLGGDAPGTVRGAFEALGFKASVSVTREQRQQVIEHLEEAAKKPGRGAGVNEATQKLEETERVARANVLWIDDNPDNNIDEVLMLRDLGLVVTQTVSSRGADRYLERAAFDLVITDLGRRDDWEAGVKDVERLRADDRPIIVYTFDPDERAERAREHGAVAITDTPAGLLEAVLAHVAR